MNEKESHAGGQIPQDANSTSNNTAIDNQIDIQNPKSAKERWEELDKANITVGLAGGDSLERIWGLSLSVHIKGEPSLINMYNELIAEISNTQNLSRTKAIRKIFDAGADIF